METYKVQKIENFYFKISSVNVKQSHKRFSTNGWVTFRPSSQIQTAEIKGNIYFINEESKQKLQEAGSLK